MANLIYFLNISSFSLPLPPSCLLLGKFINRFQMKLVGLSDHTLQHQAPASWERVILELERISRRGNRQPIKRRHEVLPSVRMESQIGGDFLFTISTLNGFPSSVNVRCYIGQHSPTSTTTTLLLPSEINQLDKKDSDENASSTPSKMCPLLYIKLYQVSSEELFVNASCADKLTLQNRFNRKFQSQQSER